MCFTLYQHQKQIYTNTFTVNSKSRKEYHSLVLNRELKQTNHMGEWFSYQQSASQTNGPRISKVQKLDGYKYYITILYLQLNEILR